jgi:triphosphoribosyl-dephospho-CoA synthetase
MLDGTLVLEAEAGCLSMNEKHWIPRVLRALVEHRENLFRCHPDDISKIWKAFTEAVLTFAKSLPEGSPTREAAVEADRSGDDFADTEAGQQLYQAAMTNYGTRKSLCVGCTPLFTRVAYAAGKTAQNDNRVGEHSDCDFRGLICDECRHVNESCGSTGYSCPEEWATAPCRLCRQAGREMLDRKRTRSGSGSDSDAAPAARARLY